MAFFLQHDNIPEIFLVFKAFPVLLVKSKSHNRTLSYYGSCEKLFLKPHLHALKNRHGTPNFWYRADDFKARHSQFSTCRRVSVPNVMWHQCSKFYGCRGYLRELVSARVNKEQCQKFGVPCRFFSTCKWGLNLAASLLFTESKVFREKF